MLIEDYAFGQIKIEGQVYHHDLILLPDKVLPNWWRKSGHLLCREDLAQILPQAPFTLIIGSGAYGELQVPAKLKKELEKIKLKIMVFPTQEAVTQYREISLKEKVIGAFHLSC